MVLARVLNSARWVVEDTMEKIDCGYTALSIAIRDAVRLQSVENDLSIYCRPLREKSHTHTHRNTHAQTHTHTHTHTHSRTHTTLMHTHTNTHTHF